VTYKAGYHFSELVVSLVEASAEVLLLKGLLEFLILVLKLDALGLESRDAQVLPIVASLQAAPHIHIVVLNNS
jgi:hypothetical protein